MPFSSCTELLKTENVQKKIRFFPFLNKPYLTFMISSLESEDYKCKNMNSLFIF